MCRLHKLSGIELDIVDFQFFNDDLILEQRHQLHINHHTLYIGNGVWLLDNMKTVNT